MGVRLAQWWGCRGPDLDVPQCYRIMVNSWFSMIVLVGIEGGIMHLLPEDGIERNRSCSD